MSNVIETCIPLDHYITNLDACEQPDESKHAKEAEELVDASHAQRLEEAERVPVIWDRGCVYVDRTSVRRLWAKTRATAQRTHHCVLPLAWAMT